jgi:ribosomal protein L21
VVEIGGHQLIVEEGRWYTVNRLEVRCPWRGQWVRRQAVLMSSVISRSGAAEAEQ